MSVVSNGYIYWHRDMNRVFSPKTRPMLIKLGSSMGARTLHPCGLRSLAKTHNPCLSYSWGSSDVWVGIFFAHACAVILVVGTNSVPTLRDDGTLLIN